MVLTDGTVVIGLGAATEIPTGDGKLYLAAVEDPFSRRLLGFAMSDRHDADLAVASLRMAATVRGGTVAGVIFHTDQGSEPGFNRWSQHLERGGVDGSASGVDEGVDGSVADEVAGGAGASAGGRTRVLAGDRQGRHR
jgi:putative transposase